MRPSPDPDAVFTVSALSSLLKETIETVFSSVAVKGEVSGLKRSAQGHMYFTLKDSRACVSCVVWRSKVMLLPFVPKDGDQVVVRGQISVYEPRGAYQIVCRSIQRLGEGDLLAELERRKRLYEAEGLFAPERKRPIPAFPSRVAVVTSPTGAAIRDILNVLKRRSGGVDIIIFPAVVQGPEAARQIARRIRQANSFAAADVIIVGRGGGSIEDLLPFSDDEVVRAVAASQIPVVSAVGHEIDWALCDYAADLRAPTPSAAAELVSRSREDQMGRIADLKASMGLQVRSRLDKARLQASGLLAGRASRALLGALAQLRQRADEASTMMTATVAARVRATRERLKGLTQNNSRIVQTRFVFESGRARSDIEKLKALSPMAILERGWAIASTPDGKVVSSAWALDKGTRFNVRFSDGTARAVSEGVEDGRGQGRTEEL